MYTLYNNDCYEQLKLMPDNSIDSIVTDPPYGISFMNKKWDYELPSVDIFKECLRVLKHGGHILVACGTRTQHRMAVNIEDAGFEIRDIISWIYSQGFPKSLNLGVAIDKIQKNEREVIGKKSNTYDGYERTPENHRSPAELSNIGKWGLNKTPHGLLETKGNSVGEGFGTNLKPAMELWTLARKPISENSIAENVLRWGTGGINIDDCRIGENPNYKYNSDRNGTTFHGEQGKRIKQTMEKKGTEFIESTKGRYPSNFIYDGSDEVLENFPYTKSGIAVQRNGGGQKIGGKGIYSGAKGTIKEDLGYADEGSASRFFYCAKVSPSERNIGFDKSSERQNNHPTLKPLSLMKYLVRLITPKNGIALDPFMGSGTTGMACMLEGFNFIGIEREKEYFDIANIRIDYVNNNKEEFLNTDKKKNKSVKKEIPIENKKDNLTIF